MAKPFNHKYLYVTKSNRIADWDRYGQHFWRATILESGALEVKYGPNVDDYDVTVYASGAWVRYEVKG